MAGGNLDTGSVVVTAIQTRCGGRVWFFIIIILYEAVGGDVSYHIGTRLVSG